MQSSIEVCVLLLIVQLGHRNFGLRFGAISPYLTPPKSAKAIKRTAYLPNNRILGKRKPVENLLTAHLPNKPLRKCNVFTRKKQYFVVKLPQQYLWTLTKLKNASQRCYNYSVFIEYICIICALVEDIVNYSNISTTHRIRTASAAER